MIKGIFSPGVTFKEIFQLVQVDVSFERVMDTGIKGFIYRTVHSMGLTKFEYDLGCIKV